MVMDSRNLSEELTSQVRRTDPDDRYSGLRAVVEAVVELGLADSVSVTESHGDQEGTVVATDERAEEVDRLQYSLDEGPCIDAADENKPELVVSDDIAADGRWPRWGPRAVQLGSHAVIAAQLYAGPRTSIGALNMFRSRAHQHVTADLEAIRVVAAHASIELARSRHDDNLWRAVDARHLIGLAQGIIMQRFDMDTDSAFRFLQRSSQHTNRKLRAVADAIVRTRKIPGVDTETG